MKIIKVQQGTPEWHEHRAKHFNASDAPAMMGCSPYESRQDLIKRLALGIEQDVTYYQQMLYDKGHQFEAAAREVAENQLGELLYPLTGVSDCGKYSASFDGLTLCDSTCFEHKMMNNEIRKFFKKEIPELPLLYRVQMEHQLMVSNAERCFFMATKWENGVCVEEYHCMYEPDHNLRKQIIQGWQLLKQDIEQYQHVDVVEIKPATTKDALPALFVTLRGEVVNSNLPQFKLIATTAIDSVNTELTCDDDFAQAESDIRWCKDVESRITAAKEHALSQTASIDELYKTLDAISELARAKRLQLNSLVSNQKDNIKGKKIQAAKDAFNDHKYKLINQNPETQLPLQVLWSPDFGAAIKGKKTLKSIDEALDNCLTQAKIELNLHAEKVIKNQEAYKSVLPEHQGLFPDLVDLMNTKDEDGFMNVLASRIADFEHKQNLAKEEREKQAAIAAAIEEEKATQEKEKADFAREFEAEFIEAAQQQMTIDAPVLEYCVGNLNAVSNTDEPELISISEINQLIAPIKLTSDDILSIANIAIFKLEKSKKLYKKTDFCGICSAIQEVIETAKNNYSQG